MGKYRDPARSLAPIVRREVAVATAAAVASMGLLVLILPPAWRRVQAWKAARTLFAPLAWNPYRRNDLRLTYALADRYRPRSVLRRKAASSASQEAFRYSHVSLARLERGGDQQGIAAAYALAGDLARARQVLEALLLGQAKPSADLTVDLAAVVAWKGHGQDEALRLLDGVLRAKPAHPQAMWNRAVLLESLDLAVAAARQFRQVAGLGERGWAAEAATRAERLESRWAHALARHQAMTRAEDGLAQGRLPPEELARAFPDAMRRGVYRGIGAAETAAELQLMVKAAIWVDGLQGGGALRKLADDPQLARKIGALLEQPPTRQTAAAVDQLATDLGDPWLKTKHWSLLAEAWRREGSPAEARQALEAGLALGQDRYPALAMELHEALSLLHTEARDLQKAQQHAVLMKRESLIRALPVWELRANERLLRMEEHRRADSLARAYAEDNALQTLDRDIRWRAQHLLAVVARGANELDEAKQHLRRSQAMERPSGTPPFDYRVVALVQELIQRGHTKDWPEADALLTESLAFYRNQEGLSSSRKAYLPIIEGRFQLARGERESGQQHLKQAISLAAALKAGAVRQRIEVPAYAALVIDAATNQQPQQALEYLAKLRGMSVPATGCLVGVVEEHQRRVFIVRQPDGRTSVVIQPPTEAGRPRAPAPAKVIALLSGCGKVAVLAAPPIFGQPGLLPEELSWVYLHGDPRPAPSAGEQRRLVVTDVRPPEALELPRLALQSTAPSRPGEQVTALVGWEATPPRVLEAMGQADEIDLHVHGILMPQVSDSPALVFSPDEKGDALLTERELADLQLTRHPMVVLGACHAARGAPYGSVHASLPGAFMTAGARLVLAAASPVEDSEAADFFDGVRRRMAAGAEPAVALRDERQSSRWQRHRAHWTRDVVLFQ